MERSVVRRSESRFEGAAGQSMFRRAWLPAEPNCVLVVVHGFAEHSGRYDTLGSWFAARGFAVHAHDHRGHGRSSGAPAFIRSIDDFVDDLDVFTRMVRAEHPGLPLVLVGHSMGGLVVAWALHERGLSAAAAITSGAALAVSGKISRARILAARALRRVLPRLSMASGLDPSGLSRDAEVVRRYVEDPLVHRRMTTSLASEILSAIERLSLVPVAVRVPMLMLHGEDDTICPSAGSRRFFERLRSPGSALRMYPKLRHEIFNEPEAEEVFQDVLDWLRAKRE